MEADSADLDSWRIFFKTAGTGVFDVIKNAIIVAAEDHPLDLMLRRDQIVHLLYSHCCPCNPTKKSIPLENMRAVQTDADTENASCRKMVDGSHSEDGRDVQDERLHPEDILKSCVKDKSSGETKVVEHPHKVDVKVEEMEDKLQGGICGTEDIDERKASNPTQLVSGKGKDMEDGLGSGIEEVDEMKVADPTQLGSGEGEEMECEVEEDEILDIENVDETGVGKPNQLVSGKDDDVKVINEEDEKIGDGCQDQIEGVEMEDKLKEGEICGIKDKDERSAANPTQLVSGKGEEMECGVKEDEILEIESIDEIGVTNHNQLVSGKGEAVKVVNEEDGKMRDGFQDQIEGEEMECGVEEDEILETENIDEIGVTNPNQRASGKGEDVKVVNEEDGKIIDGFQDQIEGVEMEDKLKGGEFSGFKDIDARSAENPTQLVSGNGKEMECGIKEDEILHIENIDETGFANPNQLVSGTGEDMKVVNEEDGKIRDVCQDQSEGEEMEDKLNEGKVIGSKDTDERSAANPTQFVSGKGKEMEDGLREVETRGIEDIDEIRVANPTQLGSGKVEEMEYELEEGEILDVENIDETRVANPNQLVSGKDEEMKVANEEDGKIRDCCQDQIKESMPAKIMASENNCDPQVLDSNVVSNGDLQESMSQKTAYGGNYLYNEGSNMNKMGGFLEKPCKELEGEGGETLEEVSRIKRLLDDSNNLSGRMLLELLTKLQNMDINMKILQETVIGKTVKPFLMHQVKDIRGVARSLIRTWKEKVDEWIEARDAGAEAQPGGLDELPLRPLIEAAPAIQPEPSKLVQIFPWSVETEFYRVLHGDCLLSEEHDITEKRETPIKVNPARDAATEKMRSENLNWESRNQSQFPSTHDAKKNNQGLILQKELGNHKGKYVSGNDLAETQIVKQVNMGTNTFSKNEESAAAIMKQRIPSLPKMHSIVEYKQGADDEGTISGHSSAMMRRRGSTLQHQPFVPTWGNNSAQFRQPTWGYNSRRYRQRTWGNNSGQFRQNPQRFNAPRPGMLSSSQRPQTGPHFKQQNAFQQDRMQVSESAMSQKVEETRLREGSQNTEDANKRRATEVIDANNPHANQQHKRFRPHNVWRNSEGSGSFPSS